MIDVTLFQREQVAVLGLARSGLAAAQALRNGGAEVLAWDDDAGKRSAAAVNGIRIADPATIDFETVRALVISPGIPHRFPVPHPLAASARAAGVEIIGDVELLVRTCRNARYVGITGTNGKSTTTSLIGHCLTQAARRVAMGGNLGTAALLLDTLGTDGIYVLEMSSYQLELAPSLACDVAVLLNITPDHLDRHGGMDGYIAAKERIFANQTGSQAAVIGVDDAICRRIADRLDHDRDQNRRVVPISAERAAPGGVYVVDRHLIDDTENRAEPVLDLAEAPRLPGRHNWQNTAAAYAALRCLGVAPSAACAGIIHFPGLAHRQEVIATIDGIRYVNDSKATNADASAKALDCFDDIYWIVGGVAKAGGIASLSAYYPRIRRAFLIGAAEADFAATLDGAVPVTRCGTLAGAVAAARNAALADGRNGAVVLLSPACASFDQFANFEERGEAFRRLVGALRGDEI